METTNKFEYQLDDGRTAICWQACSQEYADCTISAGLVEGMPPENIYLSFKRDEETMLFLRRDEAQAVAWVLNGALWSESMLTMDREPYK